MTNHFLYGRQHYASIDNDNSRNAREHELRRRNLVMKRNAQTRRLSHNQICNNSASHFKVTTDISALSSSKSPQISQLSSHQNQHRYLSSLLIQITTDISALTSSKSPQVSQLSSYPNHHRYLSSILTKITTDISGLSSSKSPQISKLSPHQNHHRYLSSLLIQITTGI